MSIGKTLKLVRLFWQTALLAEMEYRINFVLAALNSLAMAAAALFGLSLFFQAGPRLGGWSFEESLLVLGFFTLLSGVSQMFLTPNLNKIVEQVKDGTLDFVLLKPVDSQFWLSTRRFSLWGLPDALFGVGLLVYGSVKTGVTFAALFWALPPIAASLCILYSLWFVLATTTVWFVQIYNVTELLRALLDAGRFPIDAFPRGLYRIVFTFVVPVAFLTSVPARALLAGGDRDELSWISLILAALMLALTRGFWRFALRYYTSASS